MNSTQQNKESKMANVKKLEMQTIPQDDTYVQWFEIDGEHSGTGISFNNEVFGLYKDDALVNEENIPLVECDSEAIAIRDILHKTPLN
jgi:hypothetical protein